MDNRIQDTLNILLANGQKDKLAVVYGEVMERVINGLISSQLKNNNYDGVAQQGGSLFIRRFKNSISRPYGTARAVGKGDALVSDGITLKIDTNREIVEEIEEKDLLEYGVGNLIEKRKVDHVNSMIVELDTAYFVALQTAAKTVDLSANSTPQARILALIQYAEQTTVNNIDKLDRTQMVLTLTPYWFDTLRTYMTTLQNPSGISYLNFYGVEVISALRQGVDAILQIRGAVAQPVAVSPYKLEKIPLSDSWAVELFYYYGTGAVNPDGIFKGALDNTNNISA